MHRLSASHTDWAKGGFIWRHAWSFPGSNLFDFSWAATFRSVWLPGFTSKATPFLPTVFCSFQVFYYFNAFNCMHHMVWHWKAKLLLDFSSSSVSENMRVAELLLKILEDLLKADFDEFKWFLTLGLLGVCEPIPRSHLQDASRIETVDILLKRYGEEKAVKVTAEVLKKMKMNKATEDLMSSYAAGETHESATLWKCLCSFRITALWMFLSSAHRQKHTIFISFLFLPLCSHSFLSCDGSSGRERDHRPNHHGWHHRGLQHQHQQLNQPAANRSRRLQPPEVIFKQILKIHLKIKKKHACFGFFFGLSLFGQ